MADGMKNGEILRGPPSSSALCSRSMVANPPMPDAMNTPTRSRSPAPIASPASSTANCDAAIANWMKTSIFLTSFLSTNCSGSKPFTSPAICAANADASNWVIGPTPLRPAQSASQCRLGADAERRHQADARDDDSPVHAASVRWDARPAARRLRPVRAVTYFFLACASM